MVRAVRSVQRSLEANLPLTDDLKTTASLMTTEAFIRVQTALITELEQQWGKETITAIIGDGIKRLAPSEKANYDRTNRSLHAVRPIMKGEPIKAEDVAILRTEKVLRPGLHPRWLEQVIGRTARQDIPAGEGIRFEDI